MYFILSMFMDNTKPKIILKWLMLKKACQEAQMQCRLWVRKCLCYSSSFLEWSLETQTISILYEPWGWAYIDVLGRYCEFGSRPPRWNEHHNNASHMKLWIYGIYKSYVYIIL